MFSMRQIKRAGAGAVVAALLIVALDLAAPPPLDRVEELSPLAVDREGAWLHAFATEEGRWRFRADLDEIDPVFIERLIAIEDQRFDSHPGVDAQAIMRAGVSAAKAGRIVSGASTITMQAARLLEPRPRNLGSKAVEMLRAVQIERRLTKREILELYLTLAPYGGNLEGVRAASLSYFGKEPSRLTDAEQALLIALPQAPEARRPDLRPDNARLARAEILKKLETAGLLSRRLVDEAAEARLPAKRKFFPRYAYHTARRLTAESGGVVRTTLDRRLQKRAESLVQRVAAEFEDGATASLLIIDNETREVRAAVGSSGVDAPGGWIDLTGALRSPGSTLKPFIYGLAFEDGRLAPKSIIEDMPRAFGDYTPENFDRTFRGEVRVADALKHSLNLPAVATLQAVGAGRFRAAIGAAGVRLKTRKEAVKKPGLALALGGAGVTARDIAMLYAGLANGGSVAPLIWRGDEEKEAGAYQLFSACAAQRISSILADGPALEGRAPASLSQGASRIAFKTGTSYGYRDAWAAGHNAGRGAPGYTIVAWVGRADGAARPGMTGRKAAAPLLFEAFDLVLEVMGDDGEGPERLNEEEQGPTIARLNPMRDAAPPEIVFPRDGVELFSGGDARGFALAARGGAGAYRWYVNGGALNDGEERTVWTPGGAGFFDVTVVDGRGKSATSKVRVRAAG